MRNRLAAVASVFGTLAILATIGRTNADPASCLPSGLDLSKPMPFLPTVAQRAMMRASYSEPEVAGLTATIARYLVGNADKMSATELRSAHSDGLLGKPYVLLSDERNLMGGFSLIVLFPATYDVFRVWDYRLGSTAVWQVRDFERLSCDAKQRGWIRARYGAIARDVHS